jgi:hypothetical protein
MYIGVTGFTHASQVETALSHVPVATPRMLMVGVLATHKTIQGLSGGNSNRNPKREDIAHIFSEDWRTLNLVHYCTRDQSELAAQLWSALQWGGPRCDGLQMNIVWPDADVVRGLRRSKKHVSIVLQINRGCMESCGNSPDKVAARAVMDYGDTINYVLLDASGGKGVPFVPEEAAAYLKALDRARATAGQSFELLVAGGLHAGNLQDLLTPIRMVEPFIGIDAEGALRTDDVLDNGKVGAFLDTAYRFFISQ